MPVLQAILDGLERVFPAAWAEEWDNVGLQVGDRQADISSVLIALDVTKDVIAQAEDRSCQMILAHHPLIFNPLRTVDIWNNPIADCIADAIINSVDVVSLHTSVDKAPWGFNTRLALELGLKNLQTVMSDTNPATAEVPEGWPEPEREIGLGVIGELDREYSGEELVAHVKAVTGAPALRIVGDLERTVSRLALCGGSGSFMAEAARRQEADALLTADWKYHDARDVLDLSALDREFLVLDPGHYWSERLFLDDMKDHLERLSVHYGWDLRVQTYAPVQEPFRMV